MNDSLLIYSVCMLLIGFFIGFVFKEILEHFFDKLSQNQCVNEQENCPKNVINIR